MCVCVSLQASASSARVQWLDAWPRPNLKMSSWEQALVIEDPNVPGSGGISELMAFGAGQRHDCAEVLSTAMMLGEAQMIWEQAIVLFREKRQRHMANGTWPVVCREYQRRLSGANPGTMADSSKRLRADSVGSAPPTPGREAPIYGAQTPDPRAGSSGISSGASTSTLPMPNQAPPYGPPPPPVYRPDGGLRGGPPPPTTTSSTPTTSRRPTSSPTSRTPAPARVQPRYVPGTDVPLPDDTEDLRAWGQNLITFGKLAKKELTYADLGQDTSKEMVNYVKWVMDHQSTGGAKLKDLANYMIALKQLGQLATAPASPAASTSSSGFVRQMRTP